MNQLSKPFGLFVDEDRTIYVADWGNHRVVKWEFDAISGPMVVEGNGLEQLNHPIEVIFDKTTNSLIIGDMDNRRVVRWVPQDGKSPVTILDDIDCTQMVLDDQRSLNVSNCQKKEVRGYQLSEREGTVVASGHGQGSRLDQLSFPTYLVVNTDQTVYVSDTYNHCVMKWMQDAREGIIVAGGRGEGTDWTQLGSANMIVVDQLGRIYVADLVNHRLMRWHNEVMQVAGENGPGTLANQFNRPSRISFDRRGNLYVIDHENHRV